MSRWSMSKTYLKHIVLNVLRTLTL